MPCILETHANSRLIDNEQGGQIYLDVKPANTSMHLETIWMLPLTTFRLSYDSKRKRVGVIGPMLAAVIPDAVDIVPKRTLPPREKGAKPIILKNFPSVNEQTLFMYSVGATQELAQILSELSSRAEIQTREITSIHGEVTQLEKNISSSSDGGAELRMREAAAKAEIEKNEMEMTILRANNEQEYSETLRKLEEEQLSKIEELTFERLKREDMASRMRTKQLLRAKFEASQRIERTRADAAEAISLIEHEQKLVLQKAAEEMKVKTAKAVAMARADAERANEDVRIRRLQAEYDQRRNVEEVHITRSIHCSHEPSIGCMTPEGYTWLITFVSLKKMGDQHYRSTSKLSSRASHRLSVDGLYLFECSDVRRSTCSIGGRAVANVGTVQEILNLKTLAS